MSATAHVRVAKLNHPGGVLAYRIEHEGRSVVYATDTEHYACVDPALRALAEGADVLIYDSQYTPEEYRGDAGRSKVGWGHSTYVAGAELARAAGVGQLRALPPRSAAHRRRRRRARAPRARALPVVGRGARGHGASTDRAGVDGALAQGPRDDCRRDATAAARRSYAASAAPLSMSRLSLLVDLASLLAREVDFDALLGTACERLAQRAARRPRDDLARRRRARRPRDARRAAARAARRCGSRSIAASPGYVARTGEVVRVDDASRDPRFDPIGRSRDRLHDPLDARGADPRGPRARRCAASCSC